MRTKSSLLNLIFAIVGQCLGLIISFFARIVFIEKLGTDYLGLNGLFTNIVSMLSLVELGIGPAIVYSLYKPLAENDIEKIKTLMRFYRNAYVSIGLLILILGFILLPFIDYFYDSNSSIQNIELIFVLFVISSSISYFYSYKRTLIISDQKRYIATFYRYSFFFILNIIQIIVLYLTSDYILYLCCQIIITFLENIVVTRRANKLYPFLKDKKVQKIDKLTLKEIIKNVRAMVIHKLGGTVVNSTDNIIISKFVGLSSVGLYSNYQLITNALNLIIMQFFNSITASVGNLGVTESSEKKVSIFNVVLFINFWIYGFISICLIVLVNPFISIWLGSDLILGSNIVLVIILNFYLNGMRRSALTFREAFGLFWYDRHKPIFEALINLVASILLVKKYSIAGVFWGTTISILTTCFWVEPFILYKYGFKTSVKHYFLRYFKYSFVAIVACLITVFLGSLFASQGVINLVFRFIVCLIVPNVMFFAFFHRTEEFKYLINLFNSLISSIKAKGIVKH